MTLLSDRPAETQVLAQSAGPISICRQSKALGAACRAAWCADFCEAIPYSRGRCYDSAVLPPGSTLFKAPHRIQFRIATLVALALFIAQLGAIAHAYTHQPSTPDASAYQQTANNHASCDDCLNFAPLLAAAGTPALLPFSLQHTQSAPPAAAPSSFRSHRTYLAFRSRAPPVTR